MKTMVAIPCMDQVQTEFAKSLVGMKPVGLVQHTFLSCSLIYKARTDLGLYAIQENADYVLWLDSDMIFPESLLIDLLEDIKGRDIVTGLYHMRRPPYRPVIWKKIRMGMTPAENESEAYDDYPKQEIFEVEGCGFGVVLMRTEVLKAVVDKYHELFAPMPGYGEDLAFCIRARACGYKIHCDPRLQLGHKASTIVTDETFQAYREAGIDPVGIAMKNMEGDAEEAGGEG